MRPNPYNKADRGYHLKGTLLVTAAVVLGIALSLGVLAVEGRQRALSQESAATAPVSNPASPAQAGGAVAPPTASQSTVASGAPAPGETIVGASPTAAAPATPSAAPTVATAASAPTAAPPVAPTAAPTARPTSAPTVAAAPAVPAPPRPSPTAPPPTQAPAAGSAASGGSASAGATVFAATCDGCHPKGEEGVGPAIKGLPPETITRVVRAGNGMMPGFSTSQLSDQQLRDIIAFLDATN